MGLIRGILVTTLSIFLFLTLFSMSGFLTVSNSLDYDILKPELVNFTYEVSQEEIVPEINEALPTMESHCENNTEYNFPYGNFTFVIPCETIEQGGDIILTYVIEEIVEDVYYKDYNCDFWDCEEQETLPLFLFSLKAKNYWMNYFYLSLFVSLVIALGLFFVMESRSNLPFLTGGLLIFSSLPFLMINWLLKLLSGWEFVGIFSIFFTQAYIVFLIMFVIGILLIGIGFVLKFIHVGRFLSGLFKWEKKKADDKEKK